MMVVVKRQQFGKWRCFRRCAKRKAALRSIRTRAYVNWIRMTQRVLQAWFQCNKAMIFGAYLKGLEDLARQRAYARTYIRAQAMLSWVRVLRKIRRWIFPSQVVRRAWSLP